MIKSRIFQVVIALISIVLITILAVPFLFDCGHNAFDVKARNDLYHYSQIIDLYKLDHGRYPDNLDQLLGNYLNGITLDPWGNRYEYISNGNELIIFSYGDPKEKKIIYHVEGKKI
jgi:general secretion pathway protein G